MGKTYIDTVKYLVKANFEIDGIVEKPDIVGAIFGQTEGLLGDELDLRELQKNGRIGRIEVNVQMRGGKSFGNILIPSSLDMVETSILAASLEIVDRVGPCEARINTEKIEDTRNLKRKMLLDRAKALLKNVIVDEIPESKELAEMVRAEVKIAEVATYGEDKLPCGPEVEKSEAIIIVEGRADVVNMLRNGMKNVVAIGGANVGKTIVELSQQKDATLFLDGDRGGDIILREMLHAGNIDFVARAPAGKEVEELTRKEIIMALRRKIPGEQAEAELKEQIEGRESRYDNRKRFEKKREEGWYQKVQAPAGNGQARQAPVENSPQREQPGAEPSPDAEPAPVIQQEALSPEDQAKVDFLRANLKTLEGSLKAKFFNADMNEVGDAPIREIMKVLSETDGVFAVILDGIVTQRLLDLCEQKSVHFAAGIRAGNITRKPAGVKVVLAE
ncbi:MAG TPA: DNA primase DnaG [Candidatus Norongarragalinales archaeon]|nr:DNA primase DnaG [Candidatus Norongarragalinales archaeon]